MDRPQVKIPMPREQLERVVRQIVREKLGEELLNAGDDRGRGRPGSLDGGYTPNLVVNISARHLHVCQADLDKLFGPGSQLTVFRWLYQPGEFAAEQTVTVIGLGGRQKAIQNVRILGPVRAATQVEVSLTDAFALGIDAPVRASGKIDGTPGCLIVGPKGVVELTSGVIRAQRHVHMSPADAEVFGFRDGQGVRLNVYSDCPMTFSGVVCRVDPKFLLEVHLDTDEGNACNLVNATGVELSA
ncbi:MAG: phosphate propanoyltransferase [Phycisphaerae bacterium]|nr:phosphate propanoyltransferase [Phycisphaerae bacterium]